MLHDFKTEIKLLVIVAVAAITFTVGGVFLLGDIASDSIESNPIAEQSVPPKLSQCDFDGDGDCDRVDYEIFSTSIHMCSYNSPIVTDDIIRYEYNPQADADNSGCVDFIDEKILFPELGAVNGTESWQTYWNEEFGFEFQYPSSWSTEVRDSLVLLFSPATILARSSSEMGSVPPDIRVNVLSNQENLSIADFALQDDDGWFSTYAVQEEFVVAGRDAISFSDVGTEVGRAPVLVIYITVSQDQVLLLTTPGYEGALTPDRLEAWDQILSTFRFVENKYIPVGLGEVLNYASVSEINFVKTSGTIVGLTYNRIGGSILLTDDSDTYMLVTICHACIAPYLEFLPVLNIGDVVEVKGIAHTTGSRYLSPLVTDGLNKALPSTIGMLSLDENGIALVSKARIGNKYCEASNDCSLLLCGGCFSNEFLETAPPDLPCLAYEGYSCECISNTCAEVR